jgi:hypothetical protein
MVWAILAGIVVVAAVVAFELVHRSSARHHAVPALPEGADAALWSVTEVIPDPRNHLAIKDPTSELRLTDAERADAASLALHLWGDDAPMRPAEAAVIERALAAREAAIAKRAARDARNKLTPSAG